MGHRGEKPSLVLLLLLLLLLFASCHGRIVKVPAGPLVRVEGTEVVISCNVSQYDGPSEQNFDWEFSTDPTAQSSKFIHIVSTWDPFFMSQEYKDRVNSKEITLRRNSNNSVELVIGNFRHTDQGMYQCSTPSTDAVFRGNYKAAVEVKVIADGLTVSGSKARSTSTLNLSEGDPFQLRCSASTSSSEHTHLHLSWEFKNGLAWQEILSLTHEGKFQPGLEYNERYISGDIRLDAVPNDIYRLSVSQALPKDEGAYRCRVSEWVKGADGSWQKIQEKSVNVTSVVVQPTALDILLLVINTSVIERDSLDLICNFTTHRSGVFQAEIIWYFSKSSIVTMADAQVLQSADCDSTLRSLSPVDRSSYHLLVHDVDVEDTGYYFCQARLWVPQHNGTWRKIAEKTSVPVSVEVLALEPIYHVFLNASKMPKFSEDPAELECKITEIQNAETNIRFTVSWYYRLSMRSDEMVKPELLATMDADWMLVVGDKIKQRTQNGEIIFSKPAVDTFRLRIQWTSEADKGDYYCVISSWSRQDSNSWIKIKDVASMPVSILWSMRDYTLTVEAVKLKPFFVAGHTFEMTCKVSSQNIKTPRYSVLITAEKRLNDQSHLNETTRIISLNQDSVVRREDWTNQDRVDGVVLEKIQENEFRYRMYQTQISDAGLYRCVVTAWLPGGGGMWREAVNGLSNPVQIDFQTSGPVFNVSIHSHNPTVYRGELVNLFCIVTIEGATLDPEDVSFDVSLFAVRSFAMDRDPVLLASLDRKGIMTQPKREWSSDVSLDRASSLEFRLRIHGCEDQDFGNHYCVVTPWVHLAAGVWQQEMEVKSKPIFVTVKMDVLNAFKYPLLIGIGLATFIGLLSCLIGYCSSRWCCKKEVQETRRERRRLMSMEMD